VHRELAEITVAVDHPSRNAEISFRRHELGYRSESGGSNMTFQ
jgi:hypothetical protein